MKAVKIAIAVVTALAAVAGALLLVKKFFCRKDEEPVEVIEINCEEEASQQAETEAEKPEEPAADPQPECEEE